MGSLLVPVPNTGHGGDQGSGPNMFLFVSLCGGVYMYHNSEDRKVSRFWVMLSVYKQYLGPPIVMRYKLTQLKDGFPLPILTYTIRCERRSFRARHSLQPWCAETTIGLFLRPLFLGPLPLVQQFYFCIFTTLLTCYVILTVEIVINVVVLCVFRDIYSCCCISDLLENKNGWSCHAARRGGLSSVPHKASHTKNLLVIRAQQTS